MLKQTTNFSHDKVNQQFRLQEENETALVDYQMRNGKMYLTHSEVPIQLRGKGVGKILVEKTFEYIEQNNIQAVAVCSFIKIGCTHMEQ